MTAVEPDFRGMSPQVAQASEPFQRLREQMHRVIVGQDELLHRMLVGLLCRAIDARFAADPTLAVRFPNAPAARGKATESAIVFVTDRPGHDRRYAIDAGKARTEIGFAPAHSLESGIAATVAWYLDHEAWWRRVQDAGYRAWIDRHYGKGR